MLKTVKAIALLSSALTFPIPGLAIPGLAIPGLAILSTAIPSVAEEEILPQVIQPTAQPVEDGLVCYMKTSEGATLNLNNLCGAGASTPNRRITVRQTSERVPLGLTRYSNTTNGVACVAIDQQGRPCQPTQ